MHLHDMAQIFRFHTQQAKAHGVGTTGALGWKEPEGQQARFKVLAGIGDLTGRSVLDAGCGHGDLCALLGSMYSGLQYSGVDQIPALLDVAVERYGHLPGIRFMQGDFSTAALPATDYILACGSLNYRSSKADFITTTISKLFSECRIGLGFNLLSKMEEEGLLVAYDPVTIKAFCQTLTDNVVLETGYYGDDFTVFMYH